ncbi:MAG: DUF4421 family protein [Prevotella sp.]|nr:DUF4421 family protein [Prevotella sp.]MBQ6208353.1 DUF4421 family protein [Prevotella sp.]
MSKGRLVVEKPIMGICLGLRKTLPLALLILAPLCGWAGNGMGRFVKKVGEWIDSATVRGIDSTYIRVPDEPWQVMARSNINEMTFDVASVHKDESSSISWDFGAGAGMGMSFGVWAGYRGYGLGYLYTVGKQKGSNFTIGMGGSNYNVNFRLRRFHTNDTEARFQASYPERGSFLTDRDHIELDDPIKVRSLLLEGYYMFNGKHFSNTAGYDQSTIQVRSAGSLIVGASWMETDIDYAENMNAVFVMLMNDVGRIKVHQVNVGAGYAYNFVPARHWLINAMFMPTVAIVDRLKMWKYDYVFDDDDAFAIDLQGIENSHSKLMVNIGGWMTLVYNRKHWFATARGQWGRFHFDRNDTNGTLTDWYVNFGVGARF